MQKQIIGRREIADLPDFGLFHVPVKIDTGAYSSSIHISDCKEVEIQGQKMLEVVFLDENHQSFNGQKHYFSKYKMKSVKNSSGQAQIRYFIEGSIMILGKQILTVFSLTKRSGMRYPILLGRKLLNKNFIVDTQLINTHKPTKK